MPPAPALRRRPTALLAVAMLLAVATLSLLAATDRAGASDRTAPASTGSVRGTTLPTPEGGYGSYSQVHTGERDVLGWTSRDLMRQVRTRFSRYFTFKGCGSRLVVGRKCRLRVPGPDQPVRVIAVGRDGFAFLSLPGHVEGAGRTILFRFSAPVTRVLSESHGFVEAARPTITVSAWGPVSNASLLGPLNSNTVAASAWQRFADNLAARLPRCPPGEAFGGVGEGCVATI